MTARYLLLSVAFVCSVLAGSARSSENLDLKTIIKEASTAFKTSANSQEVLEDLRSRTYGKQITVTNASVTDLRDVDGLPVASARQFSGVYTLDGKTYPDPSEVDGRSIAETLQRLMAAATWTADLQQIHCSGAGWVVLSVKKDDMNFTYNLLASSYTLRRLRLGQLASVDAVISGVSLRDGRLEVFGVIRQIQEP